MKVPYRFVDLPSQDNQYIVTFGIVKKNTPFILIGNRYALLDEIELSEDDIDRIIDILTEHRKRKS